MIGPLRVIGQLRDERGSGTVLAVAVLGVAVAAALGSAALGAGLLARQRVVDAADAAALAAADVASGAVESDAGGGGPCAVAGRVAAAGGAVLAECRTDGAEAIVTTRGSALGVPLTAHARAGPPPLPGPAASAQG